jgi:hypothetical protein
VFILTTFEHGVPNSVQHGRHDDGYKYDGFQITPLDPNPVEENILAA